ncbi:MAG: hypothetical protein R3D44_17005 [Hyphomicrobiaceae bacterium]
MSSSVTADALDVSEWEGSSKGVAADAGKEIRFPRHETRSQRAGVKGAAASDRTPPWPRRKLNDALAELGPARPGPKPGVGDWPSGEPRHDLHAGVDEVRGAGESNPTVQRQSQEPAREADVGVAKPGPSEAGDLPPPPRPARQPEVPPFNAEVPGNETLAWAEAKLAEGDLKGADIVRALAAVNMPDAISHPTATPVGHSYDAEAMERPPMIIERALAEQCLGLIGGSADRGHVSAWPAAAIGFSLSLVVGAALYLVMASG